MSQQWLRGQSSGLCDSTSLSLNPAAWTVGVAQMLLPSPAQGCPPCTVQGTERERGRAEGRGREMGRAHVSWTRMACPSCTLPSCLPCATQAHSRTHFMQLCVWRPHVPHFCGGWRGSRGSPASPPTLPGPCLHPFGPAGNLGTGTHRAGGVVVPKGWTSGEQGSQWGMAWCPVRGCPWDSKACTPLPGTLTGDQIIFKLISLT